MKRNRVSILIGLICLALIVAVMPFMGACAPKETPSPTPTPTPTPAPAPTPDGVTAAWHEPEPEFVWKAQTAWPKGCGLDYLQMRTLDFIEYWTKGRVEFERYSAGEIVPGYEIFDAVQLGTIPVALSCNCYSMSKSYVSGMYCSAPNLPAVAKMAFYHGTEGVQQTKDYRTPVWIYLEELISAAYPGVVTLPSALQTTETFLYSMKPIDTIEDLKALKMRSVGYRGDVFKQAGCEVVGMPAGEVLPAMERGVIDATEFANFFGDIPLGYADTAKYIYFNPYSSQPCDLNLMFNGDAWAEVPDDLKAQIKEACFESMKWSLSECLFLDFLAFREAEEVHKATVAAIPEEVGKYIYDSAVEFYETTRLDDPELDKYMQYWEDFEAKYGKYYYLVPTLVS